MRDASLSGRVRAVVLVAVVMMLVLGSVLLAAEEPTRRERGRRARGTLQIGTPAPDFELQLLKEEVDENGERVFRISDETVKLSSFRKKQVVCIFMSSYT